jgi:integrase/recombinase XerD
LSDPDQALIDRFVDALWIEDGLAATTLAAYRRDLTLLAQWLEAQGATTLARASKSDLLGYIAARHAGRPAAQTDASRSSSASIDGRCVSA